MNPGTASAGHVPSPERSGLRQVTATFVGALVLALSLGSSVVAQEEKSSGRIVLDIPIQARVPENSREHVAIAVGGMKKSRSGAT